MRISRIVAALMSCLLWPLASPAPSSEGGLAGYWIMDEGSGEIVDECSGAGMGAEGNVSGEIHWEQTGRGPSLRFDGRSTVVRIPSNPDWEAGEGELTLSLWIKSDKANTGLILDHYFSGTPGAWGLVSEGGFPKFALYDNATKPVKLGFDGFVPGQWQHLAVVWRRASDGWLRGYLNGRFAGSIEGVNSTVKRASDLFVGGRQGVDQFFRGNVRDLAIYNRALSAQEVATLYRDGVKLNSPVVISSLRTGKVFYAPTERAAATVRVKNLTSTAQKVDLSLRLTSSLRRERELHRMPLELPGRNTRAARIEFGFEGEDYGCEVRAAVTQDSQLLAEKREFFSTSDNFWKVAIGSEWGSGLQTGLGLHGSIPESARKLYSNWYELFFWSPCDWALHVAPAKKWWSGQSSYSEDEDNLKDLIARSHAQGIKVAFYASRNPAGPFGWEVARRHPDWFGGGGFGRNSAYNVEALDMWNDPEWRKAHPGNPGWYVIGVDLRRPDALDYGIDRLIESIRHYEWDAIRFDGHYTVPGDDGLSTRNMRRLKERVWKEFPGVHFGFNYGRAPEWLGGISHEMREAMAGGGHYLQEGIRNWRYTGDSYTDWNHYVTNELRVAKQIQSLGGTYHCMWEADSLPPAQGYFKLVYGLIAGGHPAGSSSYTTTPGCPSWGAFMTRWSSMLWHSALRKADDERDRFTVENPAVQWAELLQERVESPARKYIILHLVNPPATNEIATAAFREPTAEFSVRYRPPAESAVTRVRLVRPNALPFDAELTPQPTDKALRVTVPGLQHWAMVIWEVEGHFKMPPAPPKFTEPPDLAKLTGSAGEKLAVRYDPSKERAEEEAGPRDVVIPLSSGGVNIGRVTTTDPESPQGSVQWRNKEKKSGKIGRFWTGPYPPGKYRLFIRLKWVDAQEPAAQQTLSMRIMGEKGEMLIPRPVVFATPGQTDARPGAITLGTRGKYQDYEIGTVDIKKAEYFTFDGVADTDRVGENSLYAEKIKIRPVERYTDKRLEAWNRVEKPAGLRTPNGAAPQKVLLVKGLFSKFYAIESVTPCTVTYSLPAKYEDLYAYDALVLCNMDFRTTDYSVRKVVKDFVDDGGRLVLLGGNRTLGEGGLKGTYLDELSPFALRGPNEVVRCEPPLLLGPEAGRSYPDHPSIFWRHDLSLKPHARPLAYAGKLPIAASWTAGKGTVFVFAGTTLGEGDAKQKPFWEAASWRDLTVRLMLEQVIPGRVRTK